MWFITLQKNGVSAPGLQQALGVGSYRTAWAWLHKLRRAMVRPDRDLLSGVVEVDETFAGGQSHGHKGASSEKTAVMVAVERLGPRKLGRVRFGLADAPGSLQLVDFATETVAKGSTIHTDGARMLRRLGDMGYTQEHKNGYAAKDPTNTASGSTGAALQPEVCCSTGCCSRPRTPTPTHCTNSSVALDQQTGGRSIKCTQTDMQNVRANVCPEQEDVTVMSGPVTYHLCSPCGEERVFEVPPCEDGHGLDCLDLSCVDCGHAIVVGVLLTDHKVLIEVRAA